MADKKTEVKDVKEEIVDKEIKSTEEVKETEVKSEKVEVKTENKVEDKQNTIQRIPDVEYIGDDVWKLLCRESSKSEGYIRSTKVMNVEYGCLIQVSTQQKNSDGTYAVAEALQYVPNIQVNSEGKLDKITRL